MRAIHISIFIGVLSLVLGSAHFYVCVRLAHYLSLTGGARKSLFAVGVLLFVLTIGGASLIRSLPRDYASPLAWAVYSWMGILLLMTFVMLATDIAYVVTRSVAADHALSDPGRRRAMGQMFGFAALAATGLLSGFSLWNGLRPVAAKPLQIALKRLPPALNGLRIAQLTDLHLGPTIDGAWLQAVVAKTNALTPDIVVITGDLVDGSVAALGDFASALRDLKSRYGVFFVTGNHEYYSGVEPWVAFLPTLGIRVLRNERVTLDIAGHKIDLAGVEDHASGNADLPRALAGRDPDRPVILLAHQPIAVTEAARHGVDLQLSGHTHGGQIWPWNYLVLLQQPYISGLHTVPSSDTQIYVSDGTGYWGPPMRLGTSAEITDITLIAAA